MGSPYIIGIDPGLFGAIACLDDQLCEVINVPLLPSKSRAKKEYDLLALRRCLDELLADLGCPDAVIIEEPMPMPMQNVKATARQFTGYGLWLGLLAGLPLLRVEPARWKKALGLSSKKEQSVRLAHELFPAYRDRYAPKTATLQQIEGRCEALLLAEYGRRIHAD